MGYFAISANEKRLPEVYGNNHIVRPYVVRRTVLLPTRRTFPSWAGPSPGHRGTFSLVSTV